MTKTQTRILADIATLPLDERHELFAKAFESGLLGESFYSRMSPEQRRELDASIAEADRGEGQPADVAFDELARKFGFTRAT